MRDYKFRGKRLDNGEWVYGYYCFIGFTDRQKHYIIPDYASALYVFEVDPKTVGQYTGKKLKDGKEIYEGDIVQIKLSFDEKYLYQVIWDSESGCWLFKDSIDYLSFSDIESNELEIIGTIHDQAEVEK